MAALWTIAVAVAPGPLALVGAIPMALGAIVIVGALTEWLSPILFANWGDFVSQANQNTEHGKENSNSS